MPTQLVVIENKSGVTPSLLRLRRGGHVRGMHDEVMMMIYPTQRFRLMVLTISVSGFFGFSAVGRSDRFAHAAEVKPAWQAEWEKILAAAKKEGQVTVYISGYEEVLPEFEKEYPEIKADFGVRPRLPARRSD